MEWGHINISLSLPLNLALQKIGVKETTMLNTLKNRKLSYAGHIMRNTSGHYDTLLTTIEGRLNGKRGRGRPRRTWVDDLRDWTGSKRYEQIKRAAETRRLHGKFATHSSGRNTQWMNKIITHILSYEDTGGKEGAAWSRHGKDATEMEDQQRTQQLR